MCCVGGGSDHLKGRGSFGWIYGVAHCNQLEICGIVMREHVK